MKRRIVVKIGSNVLARADGSLDFTRMSALADQIADIRRAGIEVIIVSSGAVASGRSELRRLGLDFKEMDGVDQRQLCSAVGQAKLIDRYFELFRDHGLIVGQVLTMKENFATPEQYRNQRNCMSVMLGHGVIPIVNENDTVCITELMFTDNDELSGLIAEMMDADTLIILSNVDGLYDGTPGEPGAKVIPVVEPGTPVEQYVSSSKSGLGRGGMVSKCGTAQKTAMHGVEVVIANGKREGILTALVLGTGPKPLSTRFLPAPRPESRKRTAEAIEADAVDTLLKDARRASKSLLDLSDGDLKTILEGIADELAADTDAILEANGRDLARMDSANPMYDRLRLTPERLQGIIADLRHVACLPSPLHATIEEKTLPNGLHLDKVSVPFGVVAVIYEARPNVTVDVAGLCLKSGNAVVLKGGHDAEESNKAIVAAIHRGLEKGGIDTACVTLLPSDRETTSRLLQAHDYVDVLIPRGSKNLISYVRDNAHIPIIETGAGVCHAYFHTSGDTGKGIRIITNAKTRRVSVCNALDSLLVDDTRKEGLPQLCALLADKNVDIYADPEAYASLDGHYPASLLHHADGNSFGHEFLDYKMSVKVVVGIDEAIEHIATYGSGHSDSIITEDEEAAGKFERLVDSACVYHNAPTSFTDGGQFGMGAEIGISTQKLHARGPMALKELTTYKWIIKGEGQTRP